MDETVTGWMQRQPQITIGEAAAEARRRYEHRAADMAAKAGQNVKFANGSVMRADDPPTITWDEYQRWLRDNPSPS